MIGALDKFLQSADVQDCEGDADDTMPLKELADTVRDIPRAKSPGADGLSYEFYDQFWPVLHKPFHAMVQETFVTGHLPVSMTKGRITLLYKGKGPRTDPDSYRPITLLNADYKIIAKVLATRWEGHLTSVIDPTQTAFLPSRWIGDNVLAHLEEVDLLRDTATPGCLLFLDFSKAYDRIDRGWLSRCMLALGFGPRACQWATLLHAGLSANVQYNGWLSPSFPVTSGIAQGSPLSPLLYVMAAQPLAAAVR